MSDIDKFVNHILHGDCLQILKTMPDKSVNSCITSPPYYGLRDYGTGLWVGGDNNCPHRRLSKDKNSSTGHHNQELQGNVGDGIYKTICPLCGAVRQDLQIGLEDTPEKYVNTLVNIFREVKRVLKDDGTLWLNIADSYAGGQGRWGGSNEMSEKQVSNTGSLSQIKEQKKWNHSSIKPKDLIGIPWMLAFALRDDGWYLRQDIIWHKPNPMPESVKDRCTKSHEYIFLLSKSNRYYYDIDSIREPTTTFDYTVRDRDTTKLNNTPGRTRMGGLTTNQYEMKNKRDVWSVKPSHFKEAHFAVFPEDLVYPMILASCPKDGIVLDPFMGSGTVGVVAKKNRRNYVGIELNSDYIEIAKNRIKQAPKKLF